LLVAEVKLRENLYSPSEQFWRLENATQNFNVYRDKNKHLRIERTETLT